MSGPLPHNRFKLPFFVACTAVVIYWMASNEVTPLAVAVVVVGLIAIATILSGRHPRWLQSPLDQWEAKRRQRPADLTSPGQHPD
jgi:hypothetical protein